MRIGELAHATGTTTRALRYYEEHGLLRPERSANGYRSYGPDAVRVVENIRLLLASGLTTDDLLLIEDCLRDELAGTHRCAEPAAKTALLEQRLTVVQGRIDELARVRAELLDRLTELGARPGNGCRQEAHPLAAAAVPSR
ncbi:MerR family transcriptional regulator [Streptomyces sp. DSM 110735]|uniref:MerR family transcriptional regulator n=1 Tax=Streptomyces sp. DSM 110735 TaxID=2775031 RepID=UPI0018F74B03|nr:MerR family transcriptional regulator [Streptomyces sp. DSM 110735]MBJ7906983.1 MerR family transcriptional regulator [Streptomyces sp. DSM 110735]